MLAIRVELLAAHFCGKEQEATFLSISKRRLSGRCSINDGVVVAFFIILALFKFLAFFMVVEPFFEAVQAGCWEAAKDFLDIYPVALTVRHPSSGKTALHIAVEAGHVRIVKELMSLMARKSLEIKSTWDGRTALHIAVEAGHVDLVKELVSLMEKDDLAIQSTRDGRTALAIAAIKGNTEMAKCMVEKNENLLRIPDAFNDIPLVLAYLYGHWHMARYLYSVTPAEDLMPDRGPHGAAIISNCFPSKEFGKVFKYEY